MTRMAKIAIFSSLLSLMLMFFMAPAAHAACTLGAGTRTAGAIAYNSTTRTFAYCDDTDWIQMTGPGSGTGGCTMPSGPDKPEGTILFNTDYRVIQGCAGNQWKAFGPPGGHNGFKSVKVEGSHACGLKEDNTLWCWGSDSAGHWVTGRQLPATRLPPHRLMAAEHGSLLPLATVTAPAA